MMMNIMKSIGPITRSTLIIASTSKSPINARKSDIIDAPIP